jgi:hypothetical protein
MITGNETLPGGFKRKPPEPPTPEEDAVMLVVLGVAALGFGLRWLGPKLLAAACAAAAA